MKEINDFCFRLASTSAHSSGPTSVHAKEALAILCRCFLISALVFIVSMIVFPLQYGSVDDVHMTMVVSGTGFCDRPDPHMFFSNIFLGKALVWLYSQNNNFPWFGVTLCLANIVSLTLILAVFSWERASVARKSLLLILYLFSLLSLWTNLQYTSTAIFLAGAASLCILSALEGTTLSKSGKVVAIIVSALSMVAATLLRTDASRMMLLLFSVLICCRFISWNQKQLSITSVIANFKKSIFTINKKSIFANKLIAGFLIVGALVSIVEVLNYIDRSSYLEHPEWAKFYGFNGPINKIIDYRRISFTPETKPYFDAVNWTNNDLELYRSYYFCIDPQLFSLKSAAELLSHFPIYRSDLSPNMVLTQVSTYICDKFVLPSLLFAFILVPFVNTAFISKRRHAVFLSLGVGLIAALLFFMKLETRITLPVFAYLLLISIYYADASKFKSIFAFTSALPTAILGQSSQRTRRSVTMAIAMLMVASAAAMIGLYGQRCSETAVLRQKFKNAFSAIKKLNGTICVVPSYVPYGLVSPFENPRAYFDSLPLSVPYFAVTPADKNFGKDTPYNTRLPLLEPGALSCSTDWCNERFSQYYWEHHRLRVSFQRCYADDIVSVYKAIVEPKGTH